jgi:hypothetical protein
MKSTLIHRTLTIAGAVVAFAAASFADSGDLKAKIEFPFFAQGVAMTPGTYDVVASRQMNGTMQYQLRGGATRKAVLLPSLIANTVRHNQEAQARLVFDCAGESCWLAEVWTGTGNYYAIRGPRMTFGEKTRVATVYLDAKTGN